MVLNPPVDNTAVLVHISWNVSPVSCSRSSDGDESFTTGLEFYRTMGHISCINGNVPGCDKVLQCTIPTNLVDSSLFSLTKSQSWLKYTEDNTVELSQYKQNFSLHA